MGLSLLLPGLIDSGMTLSGVRLALLPDDRLIHGTVHDVKSGQIQVNIGELMPIYPSVEVASEREWPLSSRANKLTIVVSDANLFLDSGGGPGWNQGEPEPYETTRVARRKVLHSPVGVPAAVADRQRLIRP